MRHIPEQLETLRQASANQGPLYALMDGALVPELQAALIEHQPPLEYIPLFLGDERGTLAPVSPYLVLFNSFDDSLMWWLLDEGQGKSWGIYLCSQVALTELHHHLFTLLAVRGLEGEKLYFRYYDPRVLRPFWEALTQEEKNRFMGPIQTLLVEDEKEPGFWAYRRPKALKPPPYPPAPEDWTELPEPWWEINQAQHEALMEGFLHNFLRRFADYLSKTRDELRPDLKVDFHSKEYQAMLEKQARYFMAQGFETELELTQALEYVQVFNLNLRDERVRKVIEDQSMVVKKRLGIMEWIAESKTGDKL
jgi:hypothetical protein